MVSRRRTEPTRRNTRSNSNKINTEENYQRITIAGDHHKQSQSGCKKRHYIYCNNHVTLLKAQIDQPVVEMAAVWSE